MERVTETSQKRRLHIFTGEYHCRHPRKNLRENPGRTDPGLSRPGWSHRGPRPSRAGALGSMLRTRGQACVLLAERRCDAVPLAGA